MGVTDSAIQKPGRRRELLDVDAQTAEGYAVVEFAGVGEYERAPGHFGATIIRGYGPDYDGPATVWLYNHGGHAVLLPHR